MLFSCLVDSRLVADFQADKNKKNQATGGNLDNTKSDPSDEQTKVHKSRKNFNE